MLVDQLKLTEIEGVERDLGLLERVEHVAGVPLHPLRVASEELLARVVGEGWLELVHRKVDRDHPRLQMVDVVVVRCRRGVVVV